MYKQVYGVDESGYIVGIHLAEFSEDGHLIDEYYSNMIVIDPPDGLYRAKWTGAKWVEDKTQAEFEEDAFLQSLIPSTEEIESAEFEIKILNILLEVELI